MAGSKVEETEHSTLEPLRLRLGINMQSVFFVPEGCLSCALQDVQQLSCPLLTPFLQHLSLRL